MEGVFCEFVTVLATEPSVTSSRASLLFEKNAFASVGNCRNCLFINLNFFVIIWGGGGSMT